MTRYVWHDGAWYPVGDRRPQPRLAIHSDHMDPLRHMATGEMFDSKSQFRAATRAAGCVELGNDAPVVTQAWQDDRKSIRDDLNRAYSELQAGRPAPIGAKSEGLVRRYD